MLLIYHSLRNDVNVIFLWVLMGYMSSWNCGIFYRPIYQMAVYKKIGLVALIRLWHLHILDYFVGHCIIVYKFQTTNSTNRNIPSVE
jgi:hypothetical protein